MCCVCELLCWLWLNVGCVCCDVNAECCCDDVVCEGVETCVCDCGV